MNADFGRVLGKQMEYYSFNPQADKIANVKQQVRPAAAVVCVAMDIGDSRGCGARSMSAHADSAARLHSQP